MTSNFKAISSEEISGYRKPQSKELPPRGYKEYAPDGSWVQEIRLQKALAGTKEVVSEAKVNLWGSLITGEWMPDLGKVEVRKGKGPFWQHMGHTEMKKDFLYAEEALFLMDSGIMETLYGGVPLSIQQAFSRLRSHLSIAEYHVYAHLMRQGYIVTRYIPGLDSGLTKYEKKIRLDHHMTKKQRKQVKREARSKAEDQDGGKRPLMEEGLEYEVSNKRLKAGNESVGRESDIDMEVAPRGRELKLDQTSDEVQCPERNQSYDLISMDAQSGVFPDKAVEKPGLTADMLVGEGHDLVNETVSQSPDAEVVHRTIETNSSELEDPGGVLELYDAAPHLLVNDVRTSKEWSEKLPYTNWNISEFAFLSIKDHCDFVKPKPSLLPESVNLEKCSYHVERFSLHNTSSRSSGPESSCELEFSCGNVQRRGKLKSSARNWCQYKQALLARAAEDNDVKRTPVRHLWEEDVTPLLEPQDATSTAAILEKLQVIRSKPWDHLKRPVSKSPKDVRIVFNLYSADKKSSYRKSAPPDPDYRVCVLRQDAAPPDLAMITQVMSETKDDVPFLWAVSDCGDIQFYTFTPVVMPLDINV